MDRHAEWGFFCRARRPQVEPLTDDAIRHIEVGKGRKRGAGPIRHEHENGRPTVDGHPATFYVPALANGESGM